MTEKKTAPVLYCAPMVRYSKLAFRNLVRRHGVHVCYTPMIYAKNFLESDYCRSSEFSWNEEDTPLIVQLAAKDPIVFASAAELFYKYSSGVDLNCGCPKQDVRSQGYGSSLLSQPALIADMVRQTRARINDPDFSISLKIRICQSMEHTIDLCRQAEAAGVSLLTVHGRTPSQRTEAVDYSAIKRVKEAVRVPVIANGDIKTLQEAINVWSETGVDGIMAANGLLSNPSMFTGAESTTLECVKDWISISASVGVPLRLFHHHLVFMLRDSLSPQQRRVFNDLSSRPAILEFLEQFTKDNWPSFDGCLMRDCERSCREDGGRKVIGCYCRGADIGSLRRMSACFCGASKRGGKAKKHNLL